ncbi:MAG: 1,4-dihydroxy-6-naphthoate synthase [Chitinophagaceae bacterium]|nr:MAG: 1,4-dihydroxy-6-naphthoate synthase [Chitinophagaceae bacterium]
MKLTLGFSPCPNDTFIFDALIHKKIDTGGLDFEVQYADVQTLNEQASAGLLDITKLSFFAYAHVAKNYNLMDAGSALGFGVGPMLISARAPESLYKETAGRMVLDPSLKIGIPGIHTTANLLLQVAHPESKNKIPMVFSEIEAALLAGDIDLGLIIHENRFTYAQKGLKKVQDLGEFWEHRTGCAIPLGGIVVHKRIPHDMQLGIQDAIRRSVEFAFANPRSGEDFIRAHAQEMEDHVIRQHIELYVNKYSISLGKTGKEAIDTLFEEAKAQGLVAETMRPEYVAL